MSNYKHEALHEIYSSEGVRGVVEQDDGTWELYDADGNQLDLDTETTEIEAKAAELSAAAEAEATQKAADKAAGNQKLLDLGLTQAEATALTGYTPPAE